MTKTKNINDGIKMGAEHKNMDGNGNGNGGGINKNNKITSENGSEWGIWNLE